MDGGILENRRHAYVMLTEIPKPRPNRKSQSTTPYNRFF